MDIPQEEANSRRQNRTDVLVEQYRLCVEMADKISDRRQAANGFFLTLHTGIIAVVGILLKEGDINRESLTLEGWAVTILLAVTGIALAFVWRRHVLAYSQLNGAKFRVIHEIERELPVQPYLREWILLGEGKNPNLYRPVSHIESVVPIVFGFVHAIIALGLFILIVQAIGLSERLLHLFG